MKKLLLAAAFACIAGAAQAETSTGPFWVSALKVSCDQKNGIWWQGMNGGGHFIRFYPSREETQDYEVKDKTLIVQGQPCKTEPYDCALLGISAPGKETCGIALPQGWPQ